jgi:hypothetical protein
MALQTQAGIDAEINTKLPSNGTGAVTAAALRQVLHDMNAATFQIAGSQGLINSVFRYGAAGDGTTDDARAFNAALAVNGNGIAPPASYAIAGAAITIPSGGTLETYPGAGLTYSGPGTLLIAPGGAFITKGYGDQHDGWLWARSTSGARSFTQDPLGMLGRTGSFNFAFVNAADNGQTFGIVNNLVSFQQFGGTAVTGSREALLGYSYQTAATNASNTFRDYVGGVFIAETASGDGGTLGAEQGAYFGGNSQSRLNAGASHILNATAHEFDVYNAPGCSLKWNWGINIVSFNAVQGSSNDAAIVIYSGNLAPSNGNNYGPGVGFHNGLCFAEIDSTGRPPVDSGATLIGAHLETLSSFAAANGVDLRNFSFSNLAFASPGFYVDPFGNVLTNVVGGYPGGTYLTLQSTPTVSSKILLGNSSDPTIYVRAATTRFQDPTGTTNLAQIVNGTGITLFTPLLSPPISGIATITGTLLGAPGPNPSADGLVLQNASAATASQQQASPNIHLIGQGWSTTSGTSQQLDWVINTLPAAGTSPTNSLNFNWQVNGAGFTNAMRLTTGGQLTLSGTSFPLLLVQSTGATPAFVNINDNAGGNQAGFQLLDAGTAQWQFIKQVNNAFLIYDAIGATTVLTANVNNGTFNINPANTLFLNPSGSHGVVVGSAADPGAAGSLTVSASLLVGSPTGGALGAGKINVSGGIYLNNSAYTNPDYVFEHHFTGKIEKYADRPRASDYRGRLAIDELERHVAAHLRFPGIGDEPADIFERGDIALEKLEEQALYLFELNARINRLERIANRRG